MFTKITLENDVTTEVVDNTPFNREEFQAALDGMMVAEVQLRDLEVTEANLEELIAGLTGEKNLTERESAIINMNLRAIDRLVGIGHEDVALESDGAVEITLESIKEKLGKVKDAVVRIIRKIGEFLYKVFVGLERQVAGLKKASKKFADEMKDVELEKVKVSTSEASPFIWGKSDKPVAINKLTIDWTPLALDPKLTDDSTTDVGLWLENYLKDCDGTYIAGKVVKLPEFKMPSPDKDPESFEEAVNDMNDMVKASKVTISTPEATKGDVELDLGSDSKGAIDQVEDILAE